MSRLRLIDEISTWLDYTRVPTYFGISHVGALAERANQPASTADYTIASWSRVEFKVQKCYHKSAGSLQERKVLRGNYKGYLSLICSISFSNKSLSDVLLDDGQ